MYGRTPSSYLEVTDAYSQLAIDLACACAYWENENFHYKNSKETAKGETDQIGVALEKYRKQLNERG